MISLIPLFVSLAKFLLYNHTIPAHLPTNPLSFSAVSDMCIKHKPFSATKTTDTESGRNVLINKSVVDIIRLLCANSYTHRTKLCDK